MLYTRNLSSNKKQVNENGIILADEQIAALERKNMMTKPVAR